MMNFKIAATKSKKIEKRNISFAADDEDAEFKSKKHKSFNQPELVNEISANKIKGVEPSIQNETLVIPLIVKNKYNHALESLSTDNATDEIDKEAIQALLQESNSTTNNEFTTKIAPIIQQNMVPGIEMYGNETDKFRHDVMVRPDEAELDDYDRIPVEQFGEALLRGMGWSEGKAVGKNQKKGNSSILDFKPRPRLLGLGAEPAPLVQKEKKFIKPGEKRASNPIPPLPQLTPKPVEPIKPQGIVSGSLVQVISGQNKGKHGNVVEIKHRESGVVVKVKIDGELVRVWKEDLVEFKQEQPIEAVASRLPPEKPWLRPNLKVRIISKSFKQGTLYKTKCIIHDMFSPVLCSVKVIDTGAVIEDVSQSILETIVPSVGSFAVIVQAQDKHLIGQTGKILDKSASKEQVVIQLDSTFAVHVCVFLILLIGETVFR